MSTQQVDVGLRCLNVLNAVQVNVDGVVEIDGVVEKQSVVNLSFKHNTIRFSNCKYTNIVRFSNIIFHQIVTFSIFLCLHFRGTTIHLLMY